MREAKLPFRPTSRRCRHGAMVGSILVVSLLCAQAKAWQVVGFVLEKQGTWQLAGGTTDLAEGTRLPARGRLVNKTPTDGDRISVVNLNGDLIVRIRCKSGTCAACSSNSDACYDPIAPLPEPKPAPSMLGTMLHSVMELVNGKPDRYSVHRVRGPAPLSDAVLQLDRGRLDLAPAFAYQKSGRYRIQFLSIGDRRRKSDPFSVDWHPARSNATAVPGLERGLHALLLFDADDASGSPLMDAWVLLTNPDEYSRVASAFKAASDQTAKWGTSITPDTKQRFLRAHLDYLASRPVEGPQKHGQR